MKGREFKDAVFQQFARFAAAFASPKRIEIIDALAQGERNVETLAAETGLSVANWRKWTAWSVIFSVVWTAWSRSAARSC